MRSFRHCVASPSVLQAMDRCHRLGQTKPVTVYRLVTAGTIEARIVTRAGQKRQVQQLVMAEGAAAAGGGGEGGDTSATGANEPSAEEMAALLREDEGDWDEV